MAMEATREKELKEERVLSFQSPSYALHAISEHSQTTDSFVGNTIGNFPGSTVPSSTSSCPGTSRAKESDMITRTDSALSTTSTTDGEELPRELPGSHAQQVTDRDDLTVHMGTASGTLPIVESELLIQKLEKLQERVIELEEETKHLKQEKREIEELACDKITDVISVNTQLQKALKSLRVKDDENVDLRHQHDSLQKELLDIKQSLHQMTTKYRDQLEQFEKLCDEEKVKKRQADERVRLAEEEADERARLAEEGADKRAILAEEKADKRARLAEDRAEKEAKRYQEVALKLAELQQFIEEHLHITGKHHLNLR